MYAIRSYYVNVSNKLTEIPLTPENTNSVETDKDVLRVSEPTILGPKEPERRKKKGPLLLIVVLIVIALVVAAVYAIPAIIEKP